MGSPGCPAHVGELVTGLSEIWIPTQFDNPPSCAPRLYLGKGIKCSRLRFAPIRERGIHAQPGSSST